MENNLPLEPLPLAPLHLTAEPSYWPLPIAFWVVATLLLALISAIAVWTWRRYQRDAAKREALTSLALLTQSGTPAIAELNVLLRRTALSYYPRDTIAPLQGNAWLSWLSRHGQYPAFDTLSERWNSALYGPTSLSDSDWQECLLAAKQWLQGIKGGRHV